MAKACICCRDLGCAALDRQAKSTGKPNSQQRRRTSASWRLQQPLAAPVPAAPCTPTFPHRPPTSRGLAIGTGVHVPSHVCDWRAHLHALQGEVAIPWGDMVLAEEEGLKPGLSYKALLQVPWPTTAAPCSHCMGLGQPAQAKAVPEAPCSHCMDMDELTQALAALDRAMAFSWADIDHADADGVELGISYRQLARVPWLPRSPRVCAPTTAKGAWSSVKVKKKPSPRL